MVPESFARFRIGKKLKTLRREANRSAAIVAAAAGIDEELLGRYESDAQLPTLEHLRQLADVLRVGLEHFFVPAITSQQVEVVRPAERWTVKPQTLAAKAMNFRYEALSYRLSERLMSPFLIEIPPRERVDVEPSSHPGEEFLFVLAGELAARVGDEDHELGPGDAIYFSSDAEHSLRARGAHRVQLLACVASVRHPEDRSPLDRAFGLPEY